MFSIQVSVLYILPECLYTYSEMRTSVYCTLVIIVVRVHFFVLFTVKFGTLHRDISSYMFIRLVTTSMAGDLLDITLPSMKIDNL